MRTLISFALLCLAFSCTVKNRIPETPAIHSAEFEAFYQDSTNRATVTGRIINLPANKVGEKMLKLAAVSIHRDLQQEQYPDIAEDGIQLMSYYRLTEPRSWMWNGQRG